MSVQVRLTEPEVVGTAEEYIVPPRWAVRLISTNHGKKGKHYPATWPHGYQTYPYGADGGEDVWGPMGMGRSDEDWRKAYAKHKLEEEAELNKRIIRGNLKEEQYRYWNGTQGPSASVATCRWCKQYCYGPEAMRKHQEQTDHNLILAAIYECARARKHWLCFACGGSTRHQHWGIPLCQGNRCRNKWRTAPIGEISHTLFIFAKLAFSKQLLKAWLNEDRSEKYNLDANPKKFNWERADAY